MSEQKAEKKLNPFWIIIPSIILLGIGILVGIATGINIIQIVAIVVVLGALTFWSWPLLRRIDIIRAKIIIALISIVSLLLFFKFMMNKFWDYVSVDQSWISPVIFLLTALIVSYFGRKLFRPPYDESGISFGWFVVPNIGIFGMVAVSVVRHQGLWIFYGIACAMIIVLNFTILTIVRMLSIKFKIKLPSVAYTAFELAILIISVKQTMEIAKFYNVLGQFYRWWFFTILSGSLIGGWIFIPIRKNILHLP